MHLVRLVGVLCLLFGCTEEEECTGLELTLRGPVVSLPGAGAGVVVPFSVSGCDQGDLPESVLELQVINDETGRLFGTEGETSPAIETNRTATGRLMVVLDMSDSIVSTGSRQADVVSGARVLIDAHFMSSPNAEVAVFAFGSTSLSTLEQDFSTDRAATTATLNRLASDPGRGSTNLYGAFLTSLELLTDRARSDTAVTVSSNTLVILTDGVHETGDADSLRERSVTRLESESMNRDLRLSTFAIPVVGGGNEYDQGVVCALASARENCISADPDSIEQTFRQIGERLQRVAESDFLMGVCSPLEGSRRSLTITAQDDGGRAGFLRVDYDATGFVLAGCDPSEVLRMYEASR